MPTYPEGTVRGLLSTDLITDATRDALLERLAPPPAQPQFFNAAEMSVLRAAIDRLLPQPERAPAERIDPAAAIDARLAKQEGDGWRYDQLPPDAEAFRQGLAWLDAQARQHGADGFAALPPDQQDAVLTTVQHTATADGFAVAKWFQDLLAEATETYYAHPLGQEEIGYVGMADVPGWHRIGLNELEPREPEAQSDNLAAPATTA